MGNLKSIPVCWKEADYINLDYTINLGYEHATFSEYTQQIYKQIIMVENYSLPKIMPSFVIEACKNFKHDIVVPALNKMKPGMCLPPHRDLYKKFKEIYNIDNIENITRYLVFLENSQPGQLLQVNSEVFGEWQAGDYVFWKGETIHAAYNMGTVNRYVLQVTCVDKF